MDTKDTFPTLPADVRLVVTDMDGSLLDENHQIPDDFWPLLDTFLAQNIAFAPASGRQYATLADQFETVADRIAVIAENGSVVVDHGELVSAIAIDAGAVTEVIRAVRAAGDDGLNVGVVLCGLRTAYIERTDELFKEEATRYYHALEEVDDLLDVVTGSEDKFVKIAIFDFDDAENSIAPRLAKSASQLKVVVSGAHWVDVMDPAANKGIALRNLQESLGVTPAQTVVFGDYLNDLELFEYSELSFAMDNAHPLVKERARFLAPANSEQGALQVLRRLIPESSSE
ncbi:Cof-type HAD-IIB family hydrolase [Corynebacterium ulceribovis]|uniref:Cof-type HAD-IIB family hydrolase n=1 Tax=Corynebacterium ulceribovis TaxID=487732 RepID=UPI000364191A|nr:Cof-type HAD-IIB family hydrolase [Corynebacterium ulceribovis]